MLKAVPLAWYVDDLEESYLFFSRQDSDVHLLDATHKLDEPAHSDARRYV